MTDQWFSARLRFVVAIEDVCWLHYSDSIVLLRAIDFEGALQKALRVGRGMEETYRNEANERVAWRLKEIMTIDLIRSDSLDGAEVYHESNDLPAELDHKQSLAPESSNPKQTF